MKNKLIKMKETCRYCNKEFKNLKKHLKTCKKKNKEIIKEVEIIKQVEILEITYTENELFLLNKFKDFNPNNIEVRTPDRDILQRIYLEDYNRKVNCDCAGEYVRMYCFLNLKSLEIKNKKI